MKLNIGISLTVAIAMGYLTSAEATFQFDPDGDSLTNNTVTMNQFDAVGNTSVLAVDGNQAIANYLLNQDAVDGITDRDTTFTILTQTSITGLDDTSTTPITSNSLVSGTEITVVMGFKETIADVLVSQTTGNNTAYFSVLPGETPNFFQMYYDTSPDANFLTGNGFGNDAGAQLIFDSSVTGSLSAANSFSVDTTAATSSLDGNGTDNWSGANGGAGQDTVQGTGANSNIILSTVPPTFYDNNFFLFDMLTTALLVDINLSEPFLTNDPSMNFYDTAGLAAPNYEVYDGVGGNTTLGLINGGLTITYDMMGNITAVEVSGKDFMFTTDANVTINGVNVPEPSIIGLMGFGLATLGFVARRRRKS